MMEETQAILDEEHLRLLSVGYWISTGVRAFAALFGLLYLFVGVVMGVAFSNLPTKMGNEPPPGLFMAIFGGIGFGVLVFMTGWALLNAKAARSIKARRSRTFCMVIAGLNCLNIPWGTALGVATFMVLGRASVVALFDQPPAPPVPPKNEGAPPAP